MTSATRLELKTLIQLQAQAHQIELGAHRLALSVQQGGYRSSYRGRGLEFDEVRPYQAGDDIRSIDWRVTARRGTVHTKLFREERERPIMLLVDLHDGMLFGSRVQFKSVLAGHLAALLGWAAVRSGDRIGGIVTSSQGERLVPPASRSTALLQLLQAMVTLQPTTTAPPHPGRSDAALRQLVHLAHPGSLIIVISDFRAFGNAADQALQQLSRHHDLIFSFLHDPLEANPPPDGLYPVGDHQRSGLINSADPAMITLWQQQFHHHRERLQQHCRNYHIHWMEISTTDPLPQALSQGLHPLNRIH